MLLSGKPVRQFPRRDTAKRYSLPHLHSAMASKVLQQTLYIVYGSRGMFRPIRQGNFHEEHLKMLHKTVDGMPLFSREYLQLYFKCMQ